MPAPYQARGKRADFLWTAQIKWTDYSELTSAGLLQIRLVGPGQTPEDLRGI